MNREERKKYLRFIYALTFRLFGICLVICAVVGGIYGSTMYAVWAMCAAGSIVICWGWFLYLQLKACAFSDSSRNRSSLPSPISIGDLSKSAPTAPPFRKTPPILTTI